MNIYQVLSHFLWWISTFLWPNNVKGSLCWQQLMWKSLCWVKAVGILLSSCTIALFCWVSHSGISNPSRLSHLGKCHYSVHRTISRREIFSTLWVFPYNPFITSKPAVMDSNYLAKAWVEKISQSLVVLLKYKTIQGQQQKADVWIKSGNCSFTKTRRQQKNWYMQRKLWWESSPNLSFGHMQ